ncbi:MAG TPA: TolC family protein [Candidatus Acidoferrales bacterium]|nr:TolC family protein [Candidatus Acidoferrales bacterium]
MKQIIPALAICILCAGKIFADGATNALPVLTLDAAQRLALQNHPQIAAANYRTLAAREVAKESRAGFFPNVNLYADGVAAGSDNTRILAGGLNNPSVFDRTAGGLAVSQLITDFGHTANLAASSKFQAEAENENANATREDVLLRVEAGYFGALEAQAILQVAQKTFDTRQLLADQVTLLASNKLKSDLDVSFARIALEEGRLLVERAQNDASAAMTSLSAALGLHETKEFQLVEQSPTDFSITNDVSKLVETALAQRPELMSLRAEHNAALRYAKSQGDSRLPTVSAIGVMGDAPSHDSHLPDHYAAGGIELSLPLFAGGLYTARQHEAEYRAQSDDELLRAAEDNIVRDVHLGWLNVNNALEQLQTTEQLVRNSSEAYDLAEARYKIGSSSIVELSQAQLSLTSAQIADTNARYNVLIQQTNLKHEIGALR